MLGSEHINELLHTRWAGRNLFYKDITGSTNDDARELAAKGAVHGTLVVADRQDTGRGSRGRSWETPAGANIAMSLIIRPDIPIDRVPMLTLVMGLSVAEGVDRAVADATHGNQSERTVPGDFPRCGIKWPNDVVLAGRKICGILTELHMDPDGTIGDVVIGVGINVNMRNEDFAESIRDVAGSLLTGTGSETDRSLVVARVMERFEENYEKFIRTFDLSLLKQEYEKRLLNKDRQVMLLDPRKVADVAASPKVEEKFRAQEQESAKENINEPLTGKGCKTGDETGTALGITDLGELTVRLSSGEVRNVTAGDISVRGIYGYV